MEDRAYLTSPVLTEFKSNAKAEKKGAATERTGVKPQKKGKQLNVAVGPEEEKTESPQRNKERVDPKTGAKRKNLVRSKFFIVDLKRMRKHEELIDM